MRVLLPATTVLLLGATLLATPAEAASAPTIKHTAPATGSTNGGTTVTIKGKHFTAVTAVKFGRTKGTHVHVVSSKKLTVKAPKHAAGKVDVRVITRHGKTAKGKADKFTFVAPPTVTKISPASGTALGGSRITVSGHGFTKISAVLFGSTKGTALRVLSASKLQVTTPAHAAGRADVRVRGTYGTSKIVTPDRYTFGFSIKTVTAPVPSDGNGQGLIDDMSCPAVGRCVAVGFYLTTSGELTYPLIETLSSGVWHPQVGPGTPSQPSTLSSVSCPTTTFCVAVGVYNGILTIATLSGGSWTATTAPLPADATGTGTGINDVSCSGVGACVTVGSYKDSSNVERAFLDRLSGTTWTTVHAPMPTSLSVLDEFVQSVSCSQTTLCVAGGTYQTAPSSPYRAHALIERYDGSAWHASNAPLPATSTASQLSAVSCSGAACAASGISEVSSSAGYLPFLTRYSAGVWKSVNAPRPAGSGTYASLEAVSCFGSTCRAAGGYFTTKNVELPLVDALHGSIWSAGAIGRPAGVAADAYGGLNTLSCSSSTFCAA